MGDPGARPAPRASLAVAALTLLLLAWGTAVAVLSDELVDNLAFTLAFVPPIAAFAVVGGLIARRHPGHRVGRLLGAIGLLFAVVVACSNSSRWILTSGRLPKAMGEWLSIGSSAWVVALGLLGTRLPLRLPDGRLPSPQWRWFSRLTLVLIGTATVGLTTQPGRVEGVPGTSNPLALSWSAALGLTFLGVVAAFLVSVASLVLRYRRSGARDRAQLRWVALGAGVFVGTYLGAVPFTFSQESASSDALVLVVQCAFGALPVAIGYAMLRHDLYDVDVVINRALVYGSLVLLLATAYVAGVLLLQLALRPVTRSSDLAVAGSTLAVAALFRPARSRVRATVDRRFYRSRYDAAQTLVRFTAQLRDQIDADALAGDICGVVNDTVQPTHVALWVAPKTGGRG